MHQNIKANFLMSPPLVVAYALAGTVVKDIDLHPIGQDRDGNEVLYLMFYGSWQVDPVASRLNAR